MFLGRFANVFATGAIKGVSTRAALASEELAPSVKKWKAISLFVVFPTIGLCMLNSYIKEKYHKPERPEFIPYDHMRNRVKRFPWGDGTKTLFHNPHINAQPDGYEDIDEDH